MSQSYQNTGVLELDCEQHSWKTNNVSPGQTTMTMSRISTFCARSRSQRQKEIELDQISYEIPGEMGYLPECQLELFLDLEPQQMQQHIS